MFNNFSQSPYVGTFTIDNASSKKLSASLKFSYTNELYVTASAATIDVDNDVLYLTDVILWTAFELIDNSDFVNFFCETIINQNVQSD